MLRSDHGDTTRKESWYDIRCRYADKAVQKAEQTFTTGIM